MMAARGSGSRLRNLLGWVLAIGLGLGIGTWIWLHTGTGVVVYEAPDPLTAVKTGEPPPPPFRGSIASFEERVTTTLRRTRVSSRALAGPARVTLYNVTVDGPDGARFFRAASVTGSVWLQAFQSGRLVADDVVLRSPRVLLTRPRPDAPWNYEPVLARFSAPPPRRADNGVRAEGARITLSDVVVRDGVLEVREGTAEPVRVRAADARLRLHDHQLAFEVRRGALGSATIEAVRGNWDLDGPGLGLTAELRARGVRFAEMRRLLPGLTQLPQEGTAAFALRIAPVGAGLSQLRLTDLNVSAPPSRVQGALTLRVGGTAGAQIVAADLRLTDVSLEQLEQVAGDLPYGGRISGSVTGAGEALRFELRALLTASPLGDPFPVEARGSLDLSGPEPTYDMEGRLAAVELRDLVAPNLPPARLTGSFDVEGRGFDPATMTATLHLAGRFTGWETGARDTIVIAATLDRGTLQLQQGELVLSTLTASASGEWRLIAPSSGGLDYRLAFRSLEPFGPYLPLRPEPRTRGTLETEGTLVGTLEQPQLTGTAQGAELRYGGWAASALSSRYDVTLGGPMANVDFEASARGIDTPSAGAYAAGEARVQLRADTFAVAVKAERVEGGGVELVADGPVRGNGIRELVLRNFSADLEGRRWNLVMPALVRWDGKGGLEVRGLELRESDGEGRFALDGRLPSDAGADLRFEAAALPIGDLLELLGRQPVITGQLWGSGELTGPAQNPLVDVAFELRQGKIENVAFTRFEGDIEYGQQRITATLVAALEGGGTMDARGSLPFDLAVTPRFRARLRDAGPLSGSMNAQSFPLAALARVLPFVSRPDGQLTASINLSGTPGDPLLDGTIQVQNAAFDVPAFDRRYTETTGEIVFSGRRAEVRELALRSGGWARVSGSLVFEQLTRPVADLRFSLDGFRAVGVKDQAPAGFWGELQMSGPLATPRVTGSVRLDDGSFAIPAVQQDGLDAEFADLGRPAPLAGQQLEAAEPAPWIDALTLDGVKVQAGDDLWFVSQEGRVQLSGELTLFKRGDELRIFGSLEGERGNFALRFGPLLRRFDIVRAQVEFPGTPDPNPNLDVTASRTMLGPDGRRIEILARLTGSLKHPSLSFATPGGATIPESELLSFLIFGQPGAALGRGLVPGLDPLSETVFGGIAEVAFVEIEEALVQGLGLPVDFLEIRPGGGPFGLGSPTLVFGREVADDVFLTVDAALATLFGPAEASTGIWAISLEWLVNSQLTVELSVEPVNWGRVYQGMWTALPITRSEQQFVAEVRRRWTY